MSPQFHVKHVVALCPAGPSALGAVERRVKPGCGGEPGVPPAVTGHPGSAPRWSVALSGRPRVTTIRCVVRPSSTAGPPMVPTPASVALPPVLSTAPSPPGLPGPEPAGSPRARRPPSRHRTRRRARRGGGRLGGTPTATARRGRPPDSVARDGAAAAAGSSAMGEAWPNTTATEGSVASAASESRMAAGVRYGVTPSHQTTVGTEVSIDPASTPARCSRSGSAPWCVTPSHIDARVGQQLSLPLVGRRVVDLHDSQFRIRASVTKGVQPDAQHDQLSNSALHRLGRQILGQAAAGADEPAHRPALWMCRRVVADPALGQPEDRNGERIPEQEAVLQDLVGGSMWAADHAVALGRPCRTSVSLASAPDRKRRGCFT